MQTRFLELDKVKFLCDPTGLKERCFLGKPVDPHREWGEKMIQAKVIYPKLRNQLQENPHVVGAIIFPAGMDSSVPEPVDLILLVFHEKGERGSILSYMMEIWKVKELRIPLQELMAEVLAGERQEVIDCLLKGEVLYDPENRIIELHKQFLSFPKELQSKKMCLEYSALLRHHLESKLLLKEGHLLDAHLSIQRSLLHWARLTAIESGEYPRFRLWPQVKRINPAVYKLYRELATGEEPLEQRMRLVLLAEEYAVLTKPEQYCEYLLELLASEGGNWSLGEIHRRLEQDQLFLDVTQVIEELVRRSWVEEVATAGETHAEQTYRLIHKDRQQNEIEFR